MIKAAVCGALALCLALSCAQVQKTYKRKDLPTAIPVLHITNDTTATALSIHSLSVDVVTAANIATTTFDISFYNPNDRILEGEFEFPLADGQHIIRYALDINGALREGVVVEKAKARVAFENTVRQNIDPGLVEKTKGNNFRTRIYPIPAKGYKRVVIAIEQTLEQQYSDLFYQLPLYADNPIGKFSLKATVIKSALKPQLEENSLTNFHFREWRNAYIAEYKKENFKADQTIAFAIPGSGDNKDIVLTENHDNTTYFYVNSKVEPKHKKKTNPSTVGLLWDISASGDKRDLQKETELLKKYIAELGTVTVSLIPFHIHTLAKEDFVISGGNADALLARIKELIYDGGTQFGAIDLTKYSFDEILLFSDGLSTFGKQELIVSHTPVMTITTSPSANYSYLKFIANESNGAFIDLGRQETTTALEELKGESLQILNILYNPGDIEELVTQTTPILNTGLSFAGKLKSTSADIKVQLGFGKEVVVTEEYTISKEDKSDYDQVKRIWATMQISQLDLAYEKNKEAITALGKEFSVVTQNTSLIVLDRVEDYVEHEILPPMELRNEYFAQLKIKKESERDEKSVAFDQALTAMNELKEWWNTDYTIRKKNKEAGEYERDSVAVAAAVDTTVVFNNVESAPHFRFEAEAMRVMSDSVAAGVGAYSSAAPPQSMLQEHARLADGETFSLSATPSTAVPFMHIAPDGDSENDRFDEERKQKSAISLNEWKPDEPYLKVLEKTAPKERVSKYLSLKKEYSSQPSFFVDVARFFIEKNEKAIGIQVLSNVCEMKLEDAELLRIVANQLMEANEKELALETFRQIMAMREEDPQSYRDLALAYNEAGDHNKAIELLYKLATGTWSDRFGDVKGIALNEMNAIISAYRDVVNTSAIDKRFIFAMPVDVRIVVGWSSDNSDVDLWVTDPRKEKCFYQNKQTRIGGRISQDVTQGYGPEEFLLRKALNGNYTVDVNLYGDTRQTIGGPIAIKADLFTDFGKPTQKRRTINFRVTSDKEVINLGALKFGS